MTSVVETEELKKHYGHTVALSGLDLHIPQGIVYGLIGPNGAGKTTTLKLLLDILRPSAGTVRVFGENPRIAGPRLRQRIGYIPGEFRIAGRTTGRSWLEYLARLSGPMDHDMINLLAERLDANLDVNVQKLSKGNKQKLALIQAFMHEPELLILDEPSSGLDPLIQREFLAMVAEAKGRGQTILLSSHVLSELQEIADRVGVLRAGELVADRATEDIRLGSIRNIRCLITGTDRAELDAKLNAIPQLSNLTIEASAQGLIPDHGTDSSSAESYRIRADIDGDLNPIIRALSAWNLAELAVEEPDLEQSVLRLYSSSKGTEQS
ncbi:MAG: ABC transporter ATP-binding protein [Microbacteriaceae bacterium]